MDFNYQNYLNTLIFPWWQGAWITEGLLYTKNWPNSLLNIFTIKSWDVHNRLENHPDKVIPFAYGIEIYLEKPVGFFCKTNLHWKYTM